MLKARIITAIVMLAVLLPALFLGSPLVVTILCTGIFSIACWESLRLFNHKLLIPVSVVWTCLFVWIALMGNSKQMQVMWIAGCVAWSLKFIPSLALGLPAMDSSKNRVLSAMYAISLLACFLAILTFQQHSPGYLLSVMALVWIADIGAYFFGKAFGKNKLAVSISPGKSWEGAIGGWLCVLLFSIMSTRLTVLADTYTANLFLRWGWTGLIAAATLLTVVSVLGDLFESSLKRRAMVKDSSHLLPGHGGVLDRIDALIPVLPLALMLEIVSKS